MIHTPLYDTKGDSTIVPRLASLKRQAVHFFSIQTHRHITTVNAMHILTNKSLLTAMVL